MNDLITDVEGIRVGHADNREALTGCTVFLFEGGAVAGCDIRGGAPGTRETDVLRPEAAIKRIHGLVLSGGSAYGLASAGGVMRYLEERRIGHDVGVAVVPIVPAAVIFDLSLGRHDVRPDEAMGYAACLAATDGKFELGCVGVGMGASVGKLNGIRLAMKSGVGSASASIKLGGLTVTVGAFVVVNAVGDVIDPANGNILAGARKPGGGFLGTVGAVMRGTPIRRRTNSSDVLENTTLVVVATDLDIDKVEATKIAQMTHDGVARCISPVHTLVDGDAVFAVGTGAVRRSGGDPDASVLGTVAAEVTARAIVKAIMAAEPLGGLPSHGSMWG
ncbi:MAG TPA: P1 family peptidase [Firmicutes bacterium]|nr:P1 family peptidase [Bacillota bacterium]